jgi:hypothetical protein
MTAATPAAWVEASWRNPVKSTSRAGRPVFSIDVQQLTDGRLVAGLAIRAWNPAASESRGQRIANSGQSFFTEARHGGESPIVRGRLEFFQRCDVQLLVNAFGQCSPDPRHRGEQNDRIAFSPEPIEHRKPACRHDEADRARQGRADGRKSIKTFQAFFMEDVDDTARQLSHRRRGVSVRLDAEGVGLLLFEQPGSLVKPVRHLNVHRVCQRRRRAGHWSAPPACRVESSG